MHRPIVPRDWPPRIYVGADPPASAPKLSDAVLLHLKNMQTEATSSYGLYMAQRADREAEFKKKMSYLEAIPVYGDMVKIGVTTFLAIGNWLNPPPDEDDAVKAYNAAAEAAIPFGIIAAPLDLEVTSAAASLDGFNKFVAAVKDLQLEDKAAVLAIGAALMKFRTDPKGPFLVDALKVGYYGVMCSGGLYGEPRGAFDTYSDKEQALMLRRPVAIAMLAALAAGAPLEPVQEAAIGAFLADQDSWSRTVDVPESTDQRGNVHPAKSYVTSCPWGQTHGEWAAKYAAIARAALAAADSAKPRFNISRQLLSSMAAESAPMSTPAKVAVAAGGIGLLAGAWWLLKTYAWKAAL